MTNWAPDATSIWGRCTSLAPLSRQWEVAGCSIVGYPTLAHHIRLPQQTSYIHLNAEYSGLKKFFKMDLLYISAEVSTATSFLCHDIGTFLTQAKRNKKYYKRNHLFECFITSISVQIPRRNTASFWKAKTDDVFARVCPLAKYSIDHKTLISKFDQLCYCLTQCLF